MGGWIDSFRICGPRLHGIAIKDFDGPKAPKAGSRSGSRWPRHGARGRLLRMVKGRPASTAPSSSTSNTTSGSANDGKTAITIPPAQVFAAMKRDLTTLRGQLAQAGL